MHTPLYGYGLSTGPTEGLSSWWWRNRSPPKPTATNIGIVNKQVTRHIWFSVAVTAFVTSTKLSYVEPG